MFIIIYRADDNDLHIYKSTDESGSKKVKYFYEEKEADEHAKNACKTEGFFEWQVIEINW